jgi:Flp pilus assembly protein TadG
MRTRDRGAAGVETALAVTSLLLVAFFLIGGLRVIGTNGDVVAAAHAGARAAAAERNSTAAAAAARSVVGQSLADRGVACQSMSVQASGDLTPGSLVTVDVSCTISLADVVLAGFPGARTVAATGVEQVDVIRGAPDG